jgi:hypothetical protein
MSSFLHFGRVRKAKSNATSKLVGAIVVSLVIVLLLISVALWFWGRKRTRHRAQHVRKPETRHRASTVCGDVSRRCVDQLSMYDYAAASDIFYVVLRHFGASYR